MKSSTENNFDFEPFKKINTMKSSTESGEIKTTSVLKGRKSFHDFEKEQKIKEYQDKVFEVTKLIINNVSFNIPLNKTVAEEITSLAEAIINIIYKNEKK